VKEYSATTGRLGLGLLGLEVEALGLGAFLARDHGNQLFLGLGQQRVRDFGKMDFLCHLAKMARVVKMAPTFVT
jgi:hypothetical protein